MKNHADESAGHRYLIAAVLLACGLCLAGTAHAADSSEIWPEASLYIKLNPQTRLFFNTAYAEGKESNDRSLDLAAYVDVSLKPIRKKLQTEDWQRNKYFWMRIGYDRIFKATDDSAAEVSENRGIVAFYSKALLPAEVVLEARVRADFRWIGDDYSNRYRFRVEASREFTLRGHTAGPYLNVEWFYDTRYDGWARTLWQLGSDIAVTKHFRFEAYLAYQDDRLPTHSDLNALGVNFKWYY